MMRASLNLHESIESDDGAEAYEAIAEKCQTKLVQDTKPQVLLKCSCKKTIDGMGTCNRCVLASKCFDFAPSIDTNAQHIFEVHLSEDQSGDSKEDEETGKGSEETTENSRSEKAYQDLENSEQFIVDALHPDHLNEIQNNFQVRVEQLCVRQLKEEVKDEATKGKMNLRKTHK